MRIFCLASLIFLTAFGSNAQTNIKVAGQALQPAVAVNPKNSSNIVIGCGTGQVTFSMDAGKTWEQGKMPFPASPKGEAVLRVDGQGEFFLVHNNNYTDSVTKPLRILVQSSRSGGKSWSAAVTVSPSQKNQLHPTAYAHPKKGKLAVAWVECDQLNSTDPGCQSNIFFSQSSESLKWGKPQLLSQDPGDCADHVLLTPSLLFDDEHKIYGGWGRSDAVIMDRSFDDGDTWLNNDILAFKPAGAGRYEIPGIGSIPRRIVMAQDNSRRVFKNSIYAVWADQRNGSDDTDIFFANSTRRGDLWTMPVRVNQDEKGKHQFMPAVAVDDATGIIYVVYYDRRNYTDSQTDVYLAWSTDGGSKFKEKKISDSPFVPSADQPFTDYLAIAVHKGVIVPVWVRTDDGAPSVWTTTIQQSSLLDASEVPREVKPAGNKYQQGPTQQRRN